MSEFYIFTVIHKVLVLTWITKTEKLTLCIYINVRLEFEK